MRAVKVASEMAHCVDSAELRIVVAYDPIPPYLGEPNMQEAIDARLNDAQDILQKAVKMVGDIPGEIHTELIEGNPAEAIIDVAKTRNSDVIVMGSRGLGRLAGLVLGSTSQKVVSHAPCPVLIVR
jgi:nucleotide-binding universal stress UspA family protein